MIPRERANARLRAAAVGAAALLLTLELLVRPILEPANNGDFEKVMGYAGIRYRETEFDAKYLGHVVRLPESVRSRPDRRRGVADAAARPRLPGHASVADRRLTRVCPAPTRRAILRALFRVGL